MAEKLPFTYTGADFYALCSDAMLKAVTRQASLVDAKIRALNDERQGQGQHHQQQQKVTTAAFFDHYATKDDVAVLVTEQDFLDAHRELIPSVSAGELAHYERVRASFEGGPTKEKEAEPQPQLQQRNGVGKRIPSGVKLAMMKGKGKGKAVATGSSEDEVDEVDDGLYPGDGMNGSGTRSDKGKGVDRSPFQNGRESDDEGLYD